MKFLVILVGLFFILSCRQDEQSIEQQLTTHTEPQTGSNPSALSSDQAQAKENNAPSFQTIEWTALIPKEDLDTLLNPPDYIIDIEDGSTADQVLSEISNLRQASNIDEDRYQKALISTDIIDNMDGKNIRIPGFVVPVDFDEQQNITSFFLVPYFGACLHMPPPPPNQIIYVQAETGFSLESLYDAVWVSGTLSTGLFEDPIATSAYIMQMNNIESYEEHQVIKNKLNLHN